MKLFSVAGSLLLFICLVFTSSFVSCEDYELGCGKKSHKIIAYNKQNDESFRISINDSDCSTGLIAKLSLMILNNDRTNIYCDDEDSFTVNITKENDETEMKEGWGCPQSFHNYHYGDLVMNVDFNLEDAVEFHVSRKGRWSSSYATLVATVYYESSICDDDFFDCNTINQGCHSSLQTINGQSRCISKHLKCNDYPNCGMRCNVDESNPICHPGFIFGWGDFQYMATTFLAAVFFVLSPIVIVFILFYRKRMRLQALQHRLELHNEMRAARENRMVGSISRRVSDNPPTYDDLHQTKDPPPCFCTVIAISEINEKDIKTAENTNEENTVNDTNETTKKCVCTSIKE